MVISGYENGHMHNATHVTQVDHMLHWTLNAASTPAFRAQCINNSKSTCAATLLICITQHLKQQHVSCATAVTIIPFTQAIDTDLLHEFTRENLQKDSANATVHAWSMQASSDMQAQGKPTGCRHQTAQPWRRGNTAHQTCS